MKLLKNKKRVSNLTSEKVYAALQFYKVSKYEAAMGTRKFFTIF